MTRQITKIVPGGSVLVTLYDPPVAKGEVVIQQTVSWENPADMTKKVTYTIMAIETKTPGLVLTPTIDRAWTDQDPKSKTVEVQYKRTWNVTHKATGLAIGPIFGKGAARELANNLGRLDIDWLKENPFGAISSLETRQQARELVGDAFREANDPRWKDMVNTS